jgi:hypothetical protein
VIKTDAGACPAAAVGKSSLAAVLICLNFLPQTQARGSIRTLTESSLKNLDWKQKEQAYDQPAKKLHD